MNIHAICATKEPVICGVCFRFAAGIAYNQDKLNGKWVRDKWLWLCGDITCAKLSKTVFNMKEVTRNAYEIGAVKEGIYSLFDFFAERAPEMVPILQKFTEQDITDAGMTFLRMYVATMQDRITSNAAPF